MIVSRGGDWLSAKVGDELVMMSVEKGNYIGLNDVGARVWELVETPCSLEEIYARLAQEFEVTPDGCKADVDAFLGELVKHGAAVIDPAQPVSVSPR